MLTDLVQIEHLGRQKKTENARFRAFLRRHDYSDRRLRRLGEEIESQIDCTQCANCCRVAEAGVKDRDIEKLAKFIGVSHAEFLRDYTQRNDANELILKRTTETGCVFLEGKLCSVYEARPRSCANFPHLIRGEGSVDSRMWRIVDRAVFCPIVYNWIETLKEEMGFR
jgi:Fe-S-cluster containining protein